MDDNKKPAEKNQCSYCKKEFPAKDLICFWDNTSDWHYCGGNWCPRHYHGRFWRLIWYKKPPRRDCCADPSNSPLFLCKPCYQAYQERKAQTIQQVKECEMQSLAIGVGFILLGLIIFWLARKKRKQKNPNKVKYLF